LLPKVNNYSSKNEKVIEHTLNLVLYRAKIVKRRDADIAWLLNKQSDKMIYAKMMSILDNASILVILVREKNFNLNLKS
jgi:hypothetical protein